MSRAIIYLLIVTGTLIILLVTSMFWSETQYMIYDCAAPEWDRTIPNEVREHCRNLNIDKPRGITV
jgi:hypothetical protein